MGNELEDRITAIVIPSGGSVEEDLERAERAIRYNYEAGQNAPYIISGVGPDTNKAFTTPGAGSNTKVALREDTENLDFHRELYDYMIEETEGVFGVDSLSLDSIQNILNSFPIGTSGKYPIVSYPLHLKRFMQIIKRAKRSGKISENVEIIPVSTKQSPRQFFYGITALIKDMKTIRAI